MRTSLLVWPNVRFGRQGGHGTGGDGVTKEHGEHVFLQGSDVLRKERKNKKNARGYCFDYC